QDVFSDIKKWSLGAEKFKATSFESGMKGIIKSAGFPEDVLMQENDPLCKSFVVAFPSTTMTPRIFRTYQAKVNQGHDYTVVQAARATSASPHFFKPVSISSGGVTETFIGTALGCSNPITFVLEEAVMAFGSSQSVACLVSIGAGYSSSWKPNNAFGEKIMALIHQIATGCEASAEAFAKNHDQISGFLYRFNVYQLYKMAVDDWNQQRETQAHSLAYLQTNRVKQKLKNLTNTLHDGLETTTLEIFTNGKFSANLHFKQTSEIVQALLPIIPAPSSLFTGQADILLHLKNYFDPHQSSLEMQVQKHVVLYGFGGAGKTQIALEFCDKFGSCVQLKDTTPNAALAWLCYQKKEWLMLFDSADNPNLDLYEFFPICKHANIFITSRNEASKLYAPNNHYKIQEMTSEDSLAVFYKASKRSKTEEAAVKELVKELGFLALAIVQAGSYLLYNQHIEVKQYLESYKKDMPRYLAQQSKHKLDKYQLSVYATWNLSYQKLNENAKPLLMLCGALHNYKIPVSILERAWRNLSNTHGVDTQRLHDFLNKFLTNNNEWSDELVEEAVDMLQAYSLVDIQKSENMLLDINSLLHKWAFQSLSEEEKTKAKQCAQQLFHCLGVGRLEYNDVSQWVLHIKALMTCLDYNCYDYRLAETIGKIFFVAYFWNDAEQLQQQVLDKCKEMLGSSHPHTVQAMSNLATTFWKMGKLAYAESLEQDVLEIRKKSIENSHPDTIEAMSKLAEIRSRGGKLKEAKVLQQQVLEIRKATLGINHSETMQAMSNLATTLRQSGQLEDAENFEQEVLKTRMEAFGNNHPYTIEAMSNLAVTLNKKGK
ncbi:hypothetical protein C0993_012014, partial [Termitomyces sp. T159_Od127]